MNTKRPIERKLTNLKLLDEHLVGTKPSILGGHQCLLRTLQFSFQKVNFRLVLRALLRHTGRDGNISGREISGKKDRRKGANDATQSSIPHGTYSADIHRSCSSGIHFLHMTVLSRNATVCEFMPEFSRMIERTTWSWDLKKRRTKGTNLGDKYCFA